METRTLKRVFIGLLAAAGVLLSLVAMFLLSITAQNSEQFDRLHNVLITVNIAGAVLLFALLIGNLIRLLRDRCEYIPVRFAGAIPGTGRSRNSRIRASLADRQQHTNHFSPSC